MHEISANRSARGRYAPIFQASVLSLFAAPACSPADTSLACRLTGLLNWLEAAAVVLTLVLLVVIGVAIHLIRKNRVTRKGGR